MKNVPVKNFYIGKGEPLAVMCGPCVIESEDQTLKTVEALKKIFTEKNINFIFKSSYDKANRSSVNSYRGPGAEEGLRILEKVRREFDVPVVTDIHDIEQAKAAGSVVDILQIPAFLCRQTDLLVAAAETGAIVNVKKGQFMAPWDMGNVADKIRSTGNEKVILVDRGTSFGYNNLVSDMRAIPIMQKFAPVCFDATHSVQLPGGLGATSGGQREFIPTLAKAAVAAGTNAVFIEAHFDPEKALSDAASQLAIKDLPMLLDALKAIYAVINP